MVAVRYAAAVWLALNELADALRGSPSASTRTGNRISYDGDLFGEFDYWVKNDALSAEEIKSTTLDLCNQGFALACYAFDIQNGTVENPFLLATRQKYSTSAEERGRMIHSEGAHRRSANE